MKTCCFIASEDKYEMVGRIKNRLEHIFINLTENEPILFVFKDDKFNNDCLEILAKKRHKSKTPENFCIYLLENEICDKELIDKCDICVLYKSRFGAPRQTIAYRNYIIRKGKKLVELWL